MRFWYTLLVYAVRPAAAAWVLWRGLRNRRYWEGFGERFGFGAPLATPCIWVHAVSLGEVTAAGPVVAALRARYPRHALVLTTATPTGRARAQALLGGTGARHAVRYLPYDTPGGMRRCIARLRPCLVVVMETELWPNLFAACRRRGIPVVLASARLSPTSVARYLKFGSLFRGVFRGDPVVAAQSAEDAARFAALGARAACTHVIGNVKFDVTPAASALERGGAFKAAFGARPVWIAGSTHAGEEEAALVAHAALLALRPDALLLLVPRHPERFQTVADLLARRGFRFERRSSSSGLTLGGELPGDSPVLLVDTVGELASLYAAADVALVGGSLVPVGGHNLLEPAALGIPVLTGPYHANARDIARQLFESGAALEVRDAAQLAAAVERLFADPELRRRVGDSGRAVVAANRGSIERLLALIEPLIPSAAN